MVDESDVANVRKKLDRKGIIWVNSKYTVSNEVACTEFFIKKSNGRFRIGFDDYLEKYEDATDLYFSYLRRDFDELSSAIEFALTSLSIRKDDLLKGG